MNCWPARRRSLHLAGVIPAQGGRSNKRQACSSRAISWEAGRPPLPNWHRPPANKGFYQQGKRVFAAVTGSPPSLGRLAVVARGTPDPLMKEMESWCIFNENNKAHEQTAPQALLFKRSLCRTNGELHLSWLEWEMRSVLTFLSDILSPRANCTYCFQ